jgi:hypothetical protein
MAGMHTKLSETFAYAMRIIYWHCIDALGESKKKKKKNRAHLFAHRHHNLLKWSEEFSFVQE